MPTLTEAARKVMIGESNDPTPDRDAQSKTPNTQTLRPMSRGGEFQRPVNPNSNPPVADEDDPMEPVVSPNDQQNIGAIFSKNLSKNTGWQHRPAMKDSQTAPQGLAEQGLAEDEDVEISEELQAFIDGMLEEGYSEEEILQAIEEEFEVIEEATQAQERGIANSGKRVADKKRRDRQDEEDSWKKATKNGEEKGKDLKEHIDALLEGENFSDDFRVKATAIFEAAVKDRVEDIRNTLEEAYAAALEEEVEGIYNQITEQVDAYLSYGVKEWIEENEIAIDSGLRTEITEEFMAGLKTLFAEHYIDMPEDKVNVVEELANEVKKLRKNINEETEKNLRYRQMIAEAEKTAVISDAVEGLTATQASKLRSLVENLSYNDTEELERKVYALRESYFPGDDVQQQSTLDSDVGKNVLTEETNDRMSHYVKVLGKTLPN